MRKLLLLATLLLAGLSLCACVGAEPPNSPDPLEAPTAAFIADYENLNGQSNASGTPYAEVHITPGAAPNNLRVDVLDFERTMEFIDSGTGILYIGRPG